MFKIILVQKKTAVALSMLMLAVIASLCASVIAGAQTDSTFAQGFVTEDKVERGVIVSVKPEDSKKVEIATRDHLDRLIGTVAQEPLIVTADSQTNVQVVTSGQAYTLVSDIQGDVNRGDRVTLSAIDGIGAKAILAGQIVGVAQSDFADAQAIKEHRLVDSSGEEVVVKIGLMLVEVGPTYYEPTSESSRLIPGFFQRFANSVAGREVVPLKIYVAIAIFLVGLITIAVLFYSSVRYSITAIGRNPLSAPAVHNGLVEVGIISGVTLLVTLLVVYLVLVI